MCLTFSNHARIRLLVLLSCSNPHSGLQCLRLKCQTKVKVKVKVAQSCQTLCDTMDYTVHGTLQARILEWVAFPFSRGSSQSRDRTQVSRIASGFFYQLSHKGSPSYDKSCTSAGFPGRPVVKTWPSYAGGARLIPGCGTKIPHASWPKNQNI